MSNSHLKPSPAWCLPLDPPRCHTMLNVPCTTAIWASPASSLTLDHQQYRAMFSAYSHLSFPNLRLLLAHPQCLCPQSHVLQLTEALTWTSTHNSYCALCFQYHQNAARLPQTGLLLGMPDSGLIVVLVLWLHCGYWWMRHSFWRRLSQEPLK